MSSRLVSTSMLQTGFLFFLSVCLLIITALGQSPKQPPIKSVYLQCSSEDSTLLVHYNDVQNCSKGIKRKCCSCDERVLFADDFEEGLQTAKWPKNFNGHIVKDPLNPGLNEALGFTACKWGGDTFSIPFSSNTEYYRVDLDYYMPHIEHHSGWMGFSTGFPGNHKWLLTGHAPYGQTRAVMGTTHGKWKHYSFLYRVQLPGYNWIPNPTHLRVMLEETGPRGSSCGNALFDNIVIREAKVCSKGVLFYDNFESGSVSSQLWPKNFNGYVTADSGAQNNVLKFRKCRGAGDAYSRAFSCPTGNYRITFDYKQQFAASSPYNDGGFIGLANGLPGHRQWFFGVNPNYPGLEHVMVFASGEWRRYSRIVYVPPGSYSFTSGGVGPSSSIRLIVEQYGNKNCGTVSFDNILVECVAFGCDC